MIRLVDVMLVIVVVNIVLVLVVSVVIIVVKLVVVEVLAGQEVNVIGTVLTDVVVVRSTINCQ